MNQTKDSDMLDSDVPASGSTPNSALFLASDDDSDDEYMDEAEKKEREEARIAKMIAQAEEAAARPTGDNLKRATAALKGNVRKDSTLQLVQYLETSVSSIDRKLACLIGTLKEYGQSKITMMEQSETEPMDNSAEERLSLSVSKSDFARMRVVGQFNLGFILARRQAASAGSGERACDELFIIDQHAADEKYNFERLQAETIVQNQRLVHPRKLELTAIEEEIILNYPDALVKNGFTVETDESGKQPIGQRCRLTSIPMSKEVVFNARDLEELLALLSERAGSEIPRPTKVRRMFAMRACRSSTMVGKNLTHKQMEKVVRHMGELDKPWNCPHGRPTMRHLFGLGDWQGWSEGDGLTGMGEKPDAKADWAAFMARGGKKILSRKDAKEE
jgi:DNA mismatch repair protein PMS2